MELVLELINLIFELIFELIFSLIFEVAFGLSLENIIHIATALLYWTVCEVDKQEALLLMEGQDLN